MSEKMGTEAPPPVYPNTQGPPATYAPPLSAAPAIIMKQPAA
jgi:hypothetical protein